MRDIQSATQDEVALWRKRFERQAEGDLTRAEYAIELGVDEHTWRRWERYVASLTGRVVSVRVVRRRELPPIACGNPRCGRTVVPIRGDQRFCNDKCRGVARWLRYVSRREQEQQCGREVRT